jgi:cell division septation protein DedD
VSYEKYIYQLLLENDTVIIPGLGAFVSEYQPAEISEDSDEIKPPSKTVSFNRKVRNNDGLFVGYVAENEGISHFEALKRIENERDEMLYKLDNGEEVEISKIGTLVYNKKGNIAFTPSEEKIEMLDTFGLGVTSLEEDSIEEEEAFEEEEITQVEGDAIVAEEIQEEEISESDQAEPSEESESVEKEECEEKNVVIATSDDDVAGGTENLEDVAETEKGAEETKKTITEVETKPYETEEEKKKRGWLWVLLILIPLIAISIIAFLRKSDKKENLKPVTTTTIQSTPAVAKKDSSVTDSAKIVVADSTLKDSVADQGNSVSETAEVESKLSSDVPKYYVIGGGFSVKENAEKYVDQLKKKGYQALYVEKKGSLHLVSIGVYDTWTKANAARREYSFNNPETEPWIYKKKQ